MIHVRGLVKKFSVIKKQPGIWGAFKSLFRPKKEIITAVDHIDMDIAEGEMVGYIGSNGAGKSTTIKMLTGILTPTEGEISVNGFHPTRDRMSNAMNIGVVFGQRTQLWWNLPLRESFTVLKGIYRVTDAVFDSRMGYLRELLDLDEFFAQPVRTLSLGQRMRADLAASLIHQPAILYLDEPTIGLDVLVKDRIRAAIKDFNRRYKTTVILTTHDLEDIEELCPRIIIIDAGKKVYDGTISDIKSRYAAEKRFVLEIRDAHEHAATDWNQLSGFGTDKVQFSLDNATLTAQFRRDTVKDGELLGALVSKAGVQDIKIQETGIEDIVKNIYKGKGIHAG